MKKSKIIGLSLGLFTLAGAAVATTVTLSSCSASTLLLDDFVTFNMGEDQEGKPIQPPKGAKIIREEGTNNFTVYTGLVNNEKAIEYGNIGINMEPKDKALSKQQIEKLGFNIDRSDLKINIESNKYTQFKNLSVGQEMILVDKMWIVQGEVYGDISDGKIEKWMEIPLTIKVIAKNYRPQK